MRRITKPKGRRQAAQARAKTAVRKASKPKTGAGKPSRPKTSREKVSAHRARLRKRGLRLVQMWLPDTRSPEFAAEAHRQSLRAANSPTEKEDQAFINSISWWNSEEAAALDKMEGPAPWWRSKGPAD